MSFSDEQEIRNATLREAVYFRRHSSGLPVYFCPKPGFKKRYACFATRFGSIDRDFTTYDGRRVEVPDGIAHFLEHKLFESEEGNAFDRFSKHGASSNAYTSFLVTNYLFACGNNFLDNLELLVSMVAEPFFTDENVEKEKGIMGQEIRMYDDNAGWQIYMNLLKGLYLKHAIHVDIAGTVESIGKITKEHLYDCYRTFYHPENMILFAVGDEDRERYYDRVDRALAKRAFEPHPEIQRFFPYEPDEVAKKCTEVAMEVSMPRLFAGFKDQPLDFTGRALLDNELMTDIVLEIVFGRASPFYLRLYEEKLIDDTFSASYSSYADAGHSVIGGETPDPERLAEEIARESASVVERGIASEDFERQKRAVMGSFLRHFNSLEFIANNYCTYKFSDIDLFDIVDALQALTLEQLQARMRTHLHEEVLAFSIVRPKHAK